MVRFLGPAPSVNAILDMLDFLYVLVSTFYVMCGDSIGSPREGGSP